MNADHQLIMMINNMIDQTAIVGVQRRPQQTHSVSKHESEVANHRAGLSQRRSREVCSLGVKDKQEARCHLAPIGLAHVVNRHVTS